MPFVTRRRWPTVVAVAAALTAGGGVAWATIPDSGGVIHGCYKKVAPSQGTIRVIDTEKGQKCLPNENPLDWNQTGPQGAQGLQGVPGPAGPQGPGATSVVKTLARGGGQQSLLSLDNGVNVQGSCGSDGTPFLLLSASASNLQFAGSENERPFGTQVQQIFPVAVDGFTQYNTDTAAGASDNAVGFDIIARDKSVGPFYRLDIHLLPGDPCQFWAVVTPAS